MAPRPLNRDYSLRREFADDAPPPPLYTQPSSSKHTVLNIRSSASSLSDASRPSISLPSHVRAAFPDVAAAADSVLDYGQPRVLPASLSRPDLAADSSDRDPISRALANAASTAMPREQPGMHAPHPALPDFFSRSVFRTALRNPTIAYQLRRYACARLAGESIDFLARVDQYHAMLAEVRATIASIHTDFLSASGGQQINLDSSVRDAVHHDTNVALSRTLPSLGTVFMNAQSEIEKLVYSDIYPHFVRHQMSLSAARALGANRHKYAGLGDCFVLTDPAKADNPIVFVSDGFVAVTGMHSHCNRGHPPADFAAGYQRTEIIPRNCRFLQGHHKNQIAVKRLKAAIRNREESVEILVNQRKNGDPFLNLLYTTPLFGENNTQPTFFLGGQVNCSTSIHSTNDVLRLLAQTEGDDVKSPQTTGPAKPSKRGTGVLQALRPRRAVAPFKTPGMETALLDQMEHMNVPNQMSTFYTAYSHFVIINFSTYLIGFISRGIPKLLCPIKANEQSTARAIGADVFKFLANHSPSNLSWDFKSSVKGALKSGLPISLDVKLCTRPNMGIEKFVSHWTPLKDESGAVHWIVLTLGNEQRVGEAY